MRKQNEAKMKLFHADLVAALTAAAIVAPDDWRDSEDKFTTISLPNFDDSGEYKLKTYNHRETIQKIISKAKRLPSGNRLPCARVPHMRNWRDDVKAAIAIYGDASKAAARLDAQLDIADELGLEQSQRYGLSRVVSELLQMAA